MGNLQGYEILLLVLVVVLLFGAKKLPEAARGLGRSLRIFKAEVKQPDGTAEVDSDGNVIVPTAAITQTPLQVPTPVQPVSPAPAYIPVQTNPGQSNPVPTNPAAQPAQPVIDQASAHSVNERSYGQERSDR